MCECMRDGCVGEDVVCDMYVRMRVCGVCVCSVCYVCVRECVYECMCECCVVCNMVCDL